MPLVIAPFLPLVQAPEGTSASARLYRITEDVRVIPIVVAERELFDVERKVLRRDFVECAHDAALKQRPETFDCVRVDRAANVFVAAMVDEAHRVFATKGPVALMFVGAKQADLVRDHFAYEVTDGLEVSACDHAGDHVPFALHGSRDDGFACAASSAHAATTARPLVLVSGLTADKGFIHFDEADELVELLVAKRYAYSVAHAPSRAVGAKAQHALNLEGADALLAGHHEIDDLEPDHQLDVRVLKHSADKNRKAITIRRAVLALPVIFAGCKFVDLFVFAARAFDALRPAARLKIGLAGVLMRELLFQFRESHRLVFRVLFHWRPLNVA